MPCFGQRAITDVDEVVVVAADCLGGSAVRGHLYARNVGERLREQALLHLAGNLEFAFQLGARHGLLGQRGNKLVDVDEYA